MVLEQHRGQVAHVAVAGGEARARDPLREPLLQVAGSTGSATQSGPGTWPWPVELARSRAGVYTRSSQSSRAGDQPEPRLWPKVTSYWWSLPSVTCRSTYRSGPQRLMHGHQRARLRRVELAEVAVQVQVPRRRAPARFGRAALVDARERGEPLVAVHVEDRDEQPVGAVEQRAARAAHGEVAQQHQPGVLAVDLAGVDAGVGEQRRPPVGARAPPASTRPRARRRPSRCRAPRGCGRC